MSVTGHIHHGAIVPDVPLGLPEGARVEFVLAQPASATVGNQREASIEDWAIFKDLDEQQVKELEEAILSRSPSREVDI